MCFIWTYSVLNTLSEYTYFYILKNKKSYTFVACFWDCRKPLVYPKGRGTFPHHHVILLFTSIYDQKFTSNFEDVTACKITIRGLHRGFKACKFAKQRFYGGCFLWVLPNILTKLLTPPPVIDCRGAFKTQSSIKVECFCYCFSIEHET